MGNMQHKYRWPWVVLFYNGKGYKLSTGSVEACMLGHYRVRCGWITKQEKLVRHICTIAHQVEELIRGGMRAGILG